MIMVMVTVLSVAIVFAAGMVAVLEMVWPALIIIGGVLLTLWLLDRFGVLPDKRRQRPKKRYRRKR